MLVAKIQLRASSTSQASATRIAASVRAAQRPAQGLMQQPAQAPVQQPAQVPATNCCGDQLGESQRQPNRVLIGIQPVVQKEGRPHIHEFFNNSLVQNVFFNS
jgi:hypothetical protein